MAAANADRNLLFGLLALQNSLIDEDQLVAAFRTWSRDKRRQIAECLVDDGDLDADQILDHHADDPVSRARFLLEAEVTGGLEHPGIVPVYGLGTYGDGRPYYTMRFIRGDSLKEAVDHFHADADLKKDPGRRSLELRKLLRRFADVCNAIEYAHSCGVLHRDIKPGNIIVGKHGETLVVDWGLAKPMGRVEPRFESGERTLVPSSASGSAETLPGSALGTPAYMSPEQAQGDRDRLGPQSDVYSLGATLYCLLTGKPPFEGDVNDVIRGVQSGEFASPRALDPSIDHALEAICLTAMARKPDDRHASPKALAEDVDRWMADEPVAAWREPWARTAQRWARRHRTAVTAASVAVLVALVGTAAVLAVQTRANANLKTANNALEVANAKVTRANSELAASNQRERARFELAQEAIQMFQTGVSEDLLLKQKEFGALRAKLLRGAREFYRKLEGLLGGQADRDSRRALGRAYHAVAELTSQLDSKLDSLAMHQRALALFENLLSESPNDDELKLEVVRSRAAVASQLSSVGQKAEAISVLVPARAIAQALADAKPDDLRRWKELARVARLLGALLVDSARPREGRAAMEQARSILVGLVRTNPSVEQFRFELAETCDSLALQLDEAGWRDEALAVYDRARELSEELYESNRGDARIAHALVRTLGNMAIALDGVGRRNEALASYNRARDVVGAISETNPTLLSIIRDRAWIDTSAAAVLIGIARDSDALPMLEQARKSRETLVKADASVSRDQAQLARIHTDIAGIHARAGRAAAARASYEAAVTVGATLADAPPDVLDNRSQLARTYQDFADFVSATGTALEALPWSDKAMTILRKMAETNPSQHVSRTEFADALRRHGIVLQKCGRRAESASDFREAIAILDGLANPRAVDIYDIACNQSLLSGVASEPGSGMTTAEGRAAADKAMESLRQAVAAGWNRPAHIRANSDLDPIRARPDFQMLIGDLAIPPEPFARP